jgi:gliding motility-associated-like protein
MKKTFYLLVFALCTLLVLPAAAQIPGYVPTEGLVGWWPFNGNANDESGNGHHGTVNGETLTALGVGGLYPVQLAVTSSNGCSDFINGVITVNELFNLFVPSAFTPNGDGINDVFQLQGTGIDVNNFQFDIFNRWGERVFSSTDPSQAWTGGASGGEYYIPNGVYTYYIATNSLKTGERYEYRGTISIIR